MQEIKYAVHFEGTWDRYGTMSPVQIKGYYADKQPNYEWSFTEDITKAKIWSTEKGAKQKIKHQRECSYRTLKNKIVPIKVEVDINII